MKFSKLLLASAIAMSASAFAMEDMTEEALSDATGQDGITISLLTPAAGITTNIAVHDLDGFVTRLNSGALLITGASLVTPAASPIVLTIDVTGDANNDTVTTDAMLNVGIAIPVNTVINTGAISVADSNGLGLATDSPTATILNNMTITLGATTMNLQLGNENQGAMLKLNTVMTGGLDIANFALNDANSGGSVFVGNISLNNAGSGAAGNLNVDADVNVVAAGLQITLNTVGTGGMDVSMTNVRLGTNAATHQIGGVDITGLNLTGTVITIAGH